MTNIWWLWLLVPVATLVVGFIAGRTWSREDAKRWRMDAVEMARLNNELMDRMEALEGERQKEGCQC